MEQLIYQVLPKITGEIEGITKSKKNVSQGYNFRSIDDIYTALNKLLAKNQVTVVPRVTRYDIEKYEGKNGNLLFKVIMLVDYYLYASDGSFIIATVGGEAFDSGDKSTPKALSMAYKYMAFQVFCIPVDEKLDTEYDTHEVKVAAKPEPKKNISYKVISDMITKSPDVKDLERVAVIVSSTKTLTEEEVEKLRVEYSTRLTDLTKSTEKAK